MNKRVLLLTAVILLTGLNKLVAQCNASFMLNAEDTYTRQFNYVYSSDDDSNTIFHWNFGDGDTTNTKNATHTFANVGAFQVCLTVNYRDIGCQADTCMLIHIDTTCHARFSYSYKPWTTQPEENIYFFTDSSTGEDPSTIYEWSFGTEDYSAEKNAVFTYETEDSGAEQACLQIYNSDNGCSSQYCQTIMVDNLCTGADYTYSLQENTFTFKATVCGQWDSISWDFGDGTIQMEGDSVTHTYQAALDSHYVCMHAYLSAECQFFYPCKVIECKEIQINPTELQSIYATTRGLKVYPDPANNYVHILPGEMEFPSEMKILDLTGKCLLQATIQKNADQISISALAPGIYFIQLRNALKQSSVTKFVKQ